MSDNTKAPVIVKRVKRIEGGHHGGAWKVAYADFVTAMMAFFLLMWLLNATTEQQRKGIADYFDPAIPLSRISGGGNAMLNGDSAMTEEDKAGSRRPGDRDNAPERRPSQSEARERTGAQAPGPEDADAPSPADPAPDPTEVAEAARLDGVARSIRAAVADAGRGLDQHFIVEVTPEGLVIEIVERGDAALFRAGSAVPEPKLEALIEVIVPVLGLATNPVAVIGHTDASPFRGGRSDNWALSAERATAAQRLMRGAGLDEARFARVSGMAATDPLTEDPTAPENRRIAIKLLRTAPAPR